MLIDGKALAKKIREELKEKISGLEKKPGLTVVMVGNDPASEIYVRLKEKACKEIGIISTKHHLPENTSQEELLQLISRLNSDKDVHGILVQMPTPGHIDDAKVISAISPDKDADGTHPENMGRLVIGDESLAPCTPKGIIRLIESTGTSLKGRNAVVVGRSNTVGKPVALMLLNRHATLTICHSRTQNLPEFTRKADILVVAVGAPKMIKKEMIKQDSIVIDVGISRIDKDLIGDVDYEAVKEICSITPVPGGVGPMTIAMLMENTLLCYERCQK